jgi:hypothetical protein
MSQFQSNPCLIIVLKALGDGVIFAVGEDYSKVQHHYI